MQQKYNLYKEHLGFDSEIKWAIKFLSFENFGFF